MKIAVVGTTGYISKYILDKIEKDGGNYDLLKVGRSPDDDVYLDLQYPEKYCYDSLNDVDYIIFTAAVSGPDQCSEDYERCWAINVTGTEFFVREALNRNCKVLFFSSDAVFGDVSGTIYDESSETNPHTSYGKMKKAIEDAFISENGFKALRLSYVASSQDRFVKYCLGCIRSNSTAEIFHPFYRNVITVHDVVATVFWLINNWDTFAPKVLNVAGSELVSRVRIADEINRFTGNRLRYIISMPNESFYRNRPPITQMESRYLTQYQIIPEESFTRRIQKELEELQYE